MGKGKTQEKIPFGERVKKAIGVKGDFKTAILPMMKLECNGSSGKA